MRLVSLLVLLVFNSVSIARATDWRVEETDGTVTIAGDRFASIGDYVKPGESIETGALSRVLLVNVDQSIRLGPNARIVIEKTNRKGRRLISQAAGWATYKVNRKRNPHFEVRSAYVAAVVKGTTFVVDTESKVHSVSVHEGLVDVELLSTGKHFEVPAGVRALAVKNEMRTAKFEAPSKVRKTQPNNGDIDSEDKEELNSFDRSETSSEEVESATKVTLVRPHENVIPAVTDQQQTSGDGQQQTSSDGQQQTSDGGQQSSEGEGNPYEPEELGPSGPNIIDGQDNDVVGFENNVDGDDNSVLGNLNIIEGKENTVEGDRNHLDHNHQRSVVVGDDNYVHGDDIIVIGDKNTVEKNENDILGDGNFVFGERNIIRGVWNNITGKDNSIEGDWNSVQGDDNTIVGLYNSIDGNKNTIAGDSNEIIGDENNIDGDENVVDGNKNQIDGDLNQIIGDENLLFGSSNQLTGKQNDITGNDLIINGDDQVVQNP
ncbi:MAG: hypothetical protein HKN14_02160 [Marinicaulis sp.]|nr:hypothetical protein [Marinicaulis sp.]